MSGGLVRKSDHDSTNVRDEEGIGRPYLTTDN